MLLKRCLSCARHHFYPRVICPHCHSIEVEWSEATGLGEIHTYTVARRPAAPRSRI
ncbi:Zn-ribbon domain-containing OB-fold protein [Cupriavidus sp. TA19]|uniref:Zn-ribbon domain-containing OB-fold protein n=1 Tax=Cupriavidus sp. TA19 TaxID=701108 RepID=UPI00295F2A63|nr:zinc ribbon domain-containing protein [Cupriavidus sp. TA19]